MINNIKLFKTTVFGFLVAIFFVFFSAETSAQSSEGIGIKPAVLNDALDLGAEKHFSFTVQNKSEVDQTYFFLKKDIIGAREGGEPIFATDTSEKTPYEMSEWIKLEQDSIFIPKGEERVVSFSIKVPDETSPGDHFASIITSSKPPEINKTGASVGYQVANIITIRIPGEIIDLAKIREFSTEKYFYASKNVDFKVKIENEGNVLVKPVGVVDIKNMFGKSVSTIDFNKDASGVFPKTTAYPEGIKLFNLSWKEEGLGFGRYEASLNISYGSEQKSSLYNTVTFWVLPANVIIPTIISLLVIFLIIFFVVKVHINRKVAMLTGGGSRRLVNNRRQNQFPTFLVFLSMLALTTIILIVLVLVLS